MFLVVGGNPCMGRTCQLHTERPCLIFCWMTLLRLLMQFYSWDLQSGTFRNFEHIKHLISCILLNFSATMCAFSEPSYGANVCIYVKEIILGFLGCVALASFPILPVNYTYAQTTHCFRIYVKMLLFTYKSINGLAPTSLCELKQLHVPPRALRSADQLLLAVPRSRWKHRANHTFTVVAPKL